METEIWVLGMFFAITASFLLGPLGSLTGSYIHIKDQRYLCAQSLMAALSIHDLILVFHSNRPHRDIGNSILGLLLTCNLQLQERETECWALLSVISFILSD